MNSTSQQLTFNPLQSLSFSMWIDPGFPNARYHRVTTCPVRNLVAR